METHSRGRWTCSKLACSLTLIISRRLDFIDDTKTPNLVWWVPVGMTSHSTFYGVCFYQDPTIHDAPIYINTSKLMPLTPHSTHMNPKQSNLRHQKLVLCDWETCKSSTVIDLHCSFIDMGQLCTAHVQVVALDAHLISLLWTLVLTQSGGSSSPMTHKGSVDQP
jgi:hypothetical protein